MGETELGYEKNDSRRCRSGILYTLSKLSEDGHCYSEREQLVKSAKELLQADENPIRAKKICIIVGTTKALAYPIHNMVVMKRNTRLKERLTNKDV